VKGRQQAADQVRDHPGLVNARRQDEDLPVTGVLAVASGRTDPRHLAALDHRPEQPGLDIDLLSPAPAAVGDDIDR
jgi:hypothetical protein